MEGHKQLQLRDVVSAGYALEKLQDAADKMHERLGFDNISVAVRETLDDLSDGSLGERPDQYGYFNISFG